MQELSQFIIKPDPEDLSCISRTAVYKSPHYVSFLTQTKRGHYLQGCNKNPVLT